MRKKKVPECKSTDRKISQLNSDKDKIILGKNPKD